MLSRRTRRQDDDGTVAVLVALVTVFVIMPLLAIVVDLGANRVLSTQSRGGSDAAALAAATALASGRAQDEAAAAARTLVETNIPAPAGGWAAAWAGCTDAGHLTTISSLGPCVSFDLTARTVRVTVPARPVPSVFSAVLGSRTPAASATSTASWGVSSGGCALCVLASYSTTRSVRVAGGDLAVGDNVTLLSPGETRVNGGGRLTYGGALNQWGGRSSPQAVAGGDIEDPFEGSLTPYQARLYGTPAQPGRTGACTPGVWQDITGCGTFTAGTYYVTGIPSARLNITLNADAAGVTLFFTCSRTNSASVVVAAACTSTSRPPRFQGSGTASHTLTAPPSGFALLFDENMIGGQRLNSTHQLTVNGTVYGPNVTLRDNTAGIAVVHGRVVVQGVDFRASNADVILDVDASAAAVASAAGTGPVRLVPNT